MPSEVKNQQSQAMVARAVSRLKMWIAVFQFCVSPVVDLGHSNLPSAAQNPGQNFGPGFHKLHLDTWSSVAHWFSTAQVSEDSYTAMQSSPRKPVVKDLGHTVTTSHGGITLDAFF